MMWISVGLVGLVVFTVAAVMWAIVDTDTPLKAQRRYDNQRRRALLETPHLTRDPSPRRRLTDYEWREIAEGDSQR